VARQGTYKSVADVLAASKAKPGGLNYGTPGLGTIPHLSMAELSQISKVEFNHVPFKGPAESIQMTLGGQIDFAVAPLTAAANSGLFMAGLFAEKRNPTIPDVPTVKEQGFDVVMGGWLAMIGPKGLSPAQVAYWEGMLERTANHGQWKRYLEEGSLEWQFLASQPTREYLGREYDIARALLAEIGMLK